MKPFKISLPIYVKSILLRMSIVLGFLQVTRFLFYFYNSSSFAEVFLNDFLCGVWFDLVTIALVFLPYYVLFLLPLPIRGERIHKLIFKIGFHLLSGIMVLLNLIDCAYFPFTQKRSTRDLINQLLTGDDFGQLAGTFLTEYWFLCLYLIGFVVLSELFYRKTVFSFATWTNRRTNFVKINSIWLVLFVSVFFIIGRGGIRPKPLGVLDVISYASPENAALVLNTPFTFLKTMAVNGIECKSYMSKERELTLFNPIRTSVPAHILPDSTNVVIIILESFGKEFVGSLSGKKSYSPFLDSMLNEYLSYQYAFANGKKSNEALPALLASIPTLMTKPIFRRPMPITKFCYPNLPKILSEVGYSSAFFHGATNGSMRFDSFAKTCGLDRYYGRKEYANDGHFDGVWAISDAYFNPWAAEQMSSLQPPFCSVLFTTSSHHPYHIPEEFEEQTISGPQKICVSISYADYALRLFFDKARNQPWFKNTLLYLSQITVQPAQRNAIIRAQKCTESLLAFITLKNI